MDELVCMEHSYIVVEDGRAAGVFRTLPERYAQLPVLDYGEQLILPGMTLICMSMRRSLPSAVSVWIWSCWNG